MNKPPPATSNDNERVLVSELVEALRQNPDEKDKQVRRQFELKHAQIIDAYIGKDKDKPSACLHVINHQGGDNLYIIFSSQPLEYDWVTELLLDCHGLSIEIREAIHKHSVRRICIERLFILASQLLRLIDEKPSTGPDGMLTRGSSTHRLYVAQFNKIRAFYERAALRFAQGWYFTGMVLGLGAVAMVIIAVIIFSRTLYNLNYLGARDLRIWGGALTVGAIGAIVSVMQRITSNSLRPRFYAGQKLIVLMGGFRPIVGGVFAAALGLLVLGDILPVTVPGPDAERNAHLYFFLALAFLAGFSERFAQDMFTAAQGVVARSSEDDRTTTTTQPGGATIPPAGPGAQA